MKYMKETAETARLIAEQDAKINAIKAKYPDYHQMTDDVYEEFTAEVRPICDEYKPKIRASLEVAEATAEEYEELREIWGGFFDGGEECFDMLASASDEKPWLFV